VWLLEASIMMSFASESMTGHRWLVDAQSFRPRHRKAFNRLHFGPVLHRTGSIQRDVQLW